MTITGPGAASITVDANGHRAFYLDSVTTLTISGLTLTDGGYAPLQVFGDGTIVADAMTVTGNSPDTNRGGGLNCNGGNLTLTNSTVSGNVANNGGGGLYLEECTTRIVSTTIADNQAVDGRDGGGLYVLSGTTYIENFDHLRQLRERQLRRHLHRRCQRGGSGCGHDLELHHREQHGCEQ